MLTAYRYRARTPDGELVTGSLAASDADEALATLRLRALLVSDLHGETNAQRAAAHVLRPVLNRSRQQRTFFRSLATLVRAGIPLGRALDVCAERSVDRSFAETLRAMRSELEHGRSLSTAMERRPATFPRLYAAMVRGGESGGILDDVLERLAVYVEREEAVRRKLLAALAYPAVVLASAFALVLFLLIRVVPMFEAMFRSFGVPLPAGTLAVFSLAHVAAHPALWAGIAALIVAGVVAFRVAVADPQRRALALDRVALRLPLAGGLIAKARTARSFRMAASLLQAGIDLAHAFETIIPVAGGAVHRAEFRRLLDGLREGEALADRLRDGLVFDPLLAALVAVGEETGRLDAMLATIADYFEADVESAIATLTATLEPVLIVVLGFAVGGIVFSVFLPLYSIIGSLATS